MAFFHLPKLFRAKASTEGSSGRSARAGGSGRRSKRRGPWARPRRLQFDPLEARELLSVAPTTWQEAPVTPILNPTQFTNSNQAVATDHDGDFVVAWTRSDPVVDPNTGQAIIDPVTGVPKSDENVYARYLTDEVQRVFLPDGVLRNNNTALGANGKFSLDWGGNEVQQISITATWAPFYNAQPNIQGAITFGFDLNDNGLIDNNEKTTVVFNENDLLSPTLANRPQSIMQTQFRGLGAALTDVVVEATDPHTYLVYFGDASEGKNQPLITIEDQGYSSGFYPAAEVSTVRQPTTLGNIHVSPTNPSDTAKQIQNAFLKTTQGYFMAPIIVQPAPYGGGQSYGPAPYRTPDTPRFGTPEVSVVPVLGLPGVTDGTVFDITFTGASGKQDHPEMRISAAVDDTGNDLMPDLASLPGGGDGVRTLKQSSAEFMVNPPDPVDPLTGEPDPYGQRNPAVAMDADGDFVITWESDVSDSVNFGSVSDIFARRFSPIGTYDLRGITFTANQPGPLVGTFTLQIPNALTHQLWTSDPIPFDSGALGDVATAMQDAIRSAGYSVAQVELLWGDSPDRYLFDVNFGPDVRDPQDLNGLSIVIDPGALDATANVQQKEVRGFVTEGVRSWMNDVQVVTFDPDKPGPLAGSFNLQIPNEVTNEPWISETPITFDSRKLADVANGIRAALITAGYDGASVRQLSGVDPYQFEVTFGGDQAGLDQPSIEIIPVTWDTPQNVAVAVSVADESSSTFQVNTTATNRQWFPSVGMDDAGNFVIAWANTGQDLSFFNTVSFQQYGRDGTRIGGETKATPEVTAVHYDTAVAMSPDGHFAVAWTTTNDPDWFLGNAFGANVRMSIYDQTGTLLASQLPGPGAGNPSVAFDGANNVIVSGQALAADNINSAAPFGYIDTWAIEYTVNGGVLRPQFRINGANQQNETAANAAWPHSQGGAQLGLDVDGDLTATYTGFGPDMSESVFIAGSYFSQLINDQKNADLKAFFNPATDSLYDLYGWGGQTGDIDAIIEDILIRAANPSMGNATPVQVGRLRAILDSVAGLLRGEANGVMFSQWDTDPTVQSQLTVLNSDSVANNKRDGHNTRMLLSFNATSVSGDFTIRLYGGGIGGWEDIQITPVYYPNNGPVNIEQTRVVIENALRGAARVGDNWPAPNRGYSGAVTVRTFSIPYANEEYTIRQGTPWDLSGAFDPDSDVAYEITFQGEAHDTYYYFYARLNTLKMRVGGTDVDAPWPQTYTLTRNSWGTSQYNASMAIQPDGSFVTAWTQAEQYTNGGLANSNVYFREFTETADTAGPLVTGVLSADGRVLDDNDTIVVPQGQQSAVTQIIIAFDEDMRISGPDSITNPDNYKLLVNGVVLVGGVRSVEYGMNKSADLGLGGVPRNKWEAVLTLDGNGQEDGVPPLPLGTYTVQMVPGSSSASGLRDKAGNPLGASGYNPGGTGFSRTFVVDEMTTAVPPVPPWDIPVIAATGGNGRTHPETPGAVAVDADGDYVVVWTAKFDHDNDPDTPGIDSVYFRLFNADGTPARMPDGTLAPVTPVAPLVGTGPNDGQRFGSVAVDADGDFVVTWTQYDGGEQDVYARRFNAVGTPAPEGAFRANTYTKDAQKWSGVAMDADGDFVIVWSSYGQENPTTGTGYGVYARRYDSFGLPLTQEFQVNVTTAGDQRFPSVAMASQGSFVVTWTSSANGVGDDIMYRSFFADGSPMPSLGRGEGDLYGEGVANQTVTGEQRYSDVAMKADGTGFVITWSSAGQDGSGDGAYARVFPLANVQLPRQIIRRVTTDANDINPIPATGAPIADANNLTNAPVTTTFYKTVTSPYSYQDLNVTLTIRHPRGSDLAIVLIDPLGNRYRLVTSQPRDPNGNPAGGGSFSGTIFDDQAATLIANGAPPYTGTFIPEDLLNPGNPLPMAGTWQLEITDQRTGPFEPNLFFATAIPAFLDEWSLDFQPIAAPGSEFQANSSTLGNQSYPSVAMDRIGNFVITWSGRGDQTGQDDTSGTGGVFFRKYNAQGAPVNTLFGRETRANQQTPGNQGFSSVGSDADGNIVIVWTGASSAPGNTDVYMYRSRAVTTAADTSAPWVTDVIADGQRRFAGDVIAGPLSQMTVVFDELMAIRDGATGLHSALNPNNWRLTRGGAELPGRIQSIDFPAQRNPLTRKYEATITFNPPLAAGSYALTAKDTIYDGVSQATDGPNALDGDFNGTAGTDFSATGDAGYRFDFSVASSPTQVASEIRVNQNTALEQRFSSHYGIGLAKEQSTHALAVDHDGDFVVVWTSYGQEDVQIITFDADSTGALLGTFQLRVPHAVTKVPVTSDPISFNSQALESVATGIKNALIAAGYDYAQVRQVSGVDPYQFEVTVRTWAVFPKIEYVPAATPLAAAVSVADKTSATSAGVYARVYDRNNNALTNEIPVNTLIAGDQRNAAVAVDADGDFVVVWESEDQDPNKTWGVYARRFNSKGVALDAKEFRVNTAIANDQVNPAVAMDDVGNFVVVWATGGQSYSYFNDIRGQLFDYRGQRVDKEFLVTTANLPGVNAPGSAESNPAVAMDPLGGYFAVAWDQVTAQQDGVAYDTVVMGRLFNVRDAAGNPIAPSANTSAAFQVDDGQDPVTDPEHDTEDAAGGTTTRRRARNPQIVMGTPVDTDGDGTPDRSGFIVAWESFHDNDVDGQAGADSYGIYFRRFGPDGTPEMSADHQANMVVTLPTNVSAQSPLAYVSGVLAGHQVNPSVAMDADGDYAVVWNGPGAQVHPTDPTNMPVVDVDPDGIWIRNFHAQDGVDGTPEFVSVQTRVNQTRQAIQEFPTIGMTRDGQRVVAWSGRGTDDANGIYFRRYPEPTDTAGPLVSDVVANGVSAGVSAIQPKQTGSGPAAPIVLNTQSPYVSGGVSSLVVVFDEDMFNVLSPGSSDPLDIEYAKDSVSNRANYRLLKDGADVSGLIKNNIDFRLNPLTNKYEATLELDSDPSTPALDPLPDGEYELRVMGNVRDKMGNPMGVTGLFQDGYEYVFTQFDVGVSGGGDPTQPGDPVNSLSTAGRQDSPAVAKGADGSYVVVWATYGQTVTRIVNGTPQQFVDGFNQGNIAAQLFDARGTKIGSEIVVNTRLTGSQIAPDVAMDAAGNFVVVWSGEGQEGLGGSVDTTGVFYRRFDVNGNALDAYEHRVNTYTKNVQNQPAVAMDPQGDFVIVWSGEGRAGKPNGKGAFDSRGVWARRYSSLGLPANAYQVVVNRTKSRTQEAPDVAMDGDGDYFVVWRSERQGRGAWSVYGQRFNKTGIRAGRETRLNTRAYGAKLYPQVAMDDAGNSVVIWSGMRAEGYGDHVYKRQFRANATAIDRKEVAVDDAGSAAYLKQQASVAMSGDGKYLVVSWTSFAQDEATADPPQRNDGVYAHMLYNPNPGVPTSPWGEYKVNGNPLGDYRLNASVAGNQNDSAVAMAPNGDMTAVWVGPNPNDLTSGNDIWARNVAVGPSGAASSVQASVVGASSASQSVSLAAASTAGAVPASSGEGDRAALTDSALNDAFSGYADLPVGPALGSANLSPSADLTATASSADTAKLYDSALIDLLSLEGSPAPWTDLDATFGLPASGLGTVNGTTLW